MPARSGDGRIRITVDRLQVALLVLACAIGVAAVFSLGIIAGIGLSRHEQPDAGISTSAPEAISPPAAPPPPAQPAAAQPSTQPQPEKPAVEKRENVERRPLPIPDRDRREAKTRPPATERKAVQPAPEAAAFAVQVGAFTDLEQALKQAASLEARGYKASIATESRQDGVIYRLRVATFPDKQSAAAFRDELEKKEGIKGFITPLKQ